MFPLSVRVTKEGLPVIVNDKLSPSASLAETDVIFDVPLSNVILSIKERTGALFNASNSTTKVGLFDAISLSDV